MYSDNLEGWIYGVVKDYEYCLEKYPEKVKEFSSVKKEWQGLTDEEIHDLSVTMVKGYKSVNWLTVALEAKLKDKNTCK
jgi:hypothetical protein